MKHNKWQLLSRKKADTIPDIIKTLLNNRNIKTKKEIDDFMNPNIDLITPDSVGIDRAQLDKAVERVGKAISDKEQIVIYGDYDVDGVCGAAVLWESLYKRYKNVRPHIPHRVEEGYGLSIKGIDYILENAPETKLIITVDNGIVANEAVDYAVSRGLDVIVTDHHVASSILPNAHSIVHTTNLCGAGVAYMFALQIENGSPNKLDPRLDLVALATVADLVPLTRANRAFVKYGIEALRKTARPGLIALFEEAKIKKDEIGTYHIGHMIGPRINAAGRIAHALDSLRLICTKDPLRAKELAGLLGETNKSRQTLTEDLTLHAASLTKMISIEDKMIIVYDKSYNPGVIGLIASRLVEAHYRPSIVMSIGDEVAKGSARSIAGFNIIEFIREFRHLLVDAGGHPMAAGFTIQIEKIEEFRSELTKRANEFIEDSLLERKIEIDMEISLELATLNAYKAIRDLEPYGMKNPVPLFFTKNARVISADLVGKEKNHLKLRLSGNGVSIDAMFFRQTENRFNIGDEVDFVYQIESNTWNGNTKLQLLVRDMVISGK